MLKGVVKECSKRVLKGVSMVLTSFEGGNRGLLGETGQDGTTNATERSKRIKFVFLSSVFQKNKN